MKLNTNYLSAVTLSIVIVAAGMFLSSTHARADAAAGEVTYNAKSAACHGSDAKGKDALKTKNCASPGGPKDE
jgi:cytochrome c